MRHSVDKFSKVDVAKGNYRGKTLECFFNKNLMQQRENRADK
jgi:hypothetical protein